MKAVDSKEFIVEAETPKLSEYKYTHIYLYKINNMIRIHDLKTDYSGLTDHITFLTDPSNSF